MGRTYMNLPSAARPHIKFLCGDQVYLDDPWHDFLNPFRSRNWLEHRSFKIYLDNWSQQTAEGGFGQLLKNGANFFSSDDHEFWNNAPDIGLTVPFFTLRIGDAKSGGRLRLISTRFFKPFPVRRSDSKSIHSHFAFARRASTEAEAAVTLCRRQILGDRQLDSKLD